jgi:hypothetical protein
MTEDRLDWNISGTVSVFGGLTTLPYSYSGEIDPKTLTPGARS